MGVSLQSRDLPHVVYCMFDADEQALYIGCTAYPAYRLGDHSGRDWFGDVSYAHFEHFDGVDDALVRERELIEALQPLHNRRYTKNDLARKQHLVPVIDPGEKDDSNKAEQEPAA